MPEKNLCALNFGMSSNRQFPGFRHDICYWDPSGWQGLQCAVENTGTPLWFRNNFLSALGASSEVFELRPVCQWERGVPPGHDFFFSFKEEWKSWKRRATSFGLCQSIALWNVSESKRLNKSLKKGGGRGGRGAVAGVRPKGGGNIVTSVPDLWLGCREL